MADEKLDDEHKAKAARAEALKEQDNPPAPYPSQDQLNAIAAGEPLDDDEDEPAAPKKPEPKKAMAAEQPASGYQTR